MTKTLLHIWPVNGAETDSNALSLYPPHLAFKLTNALEWAGRAIGEAFYNKVLITVTTSVRFAGQTFKLAPKLNIPTLILTF